MLKFEEPRQSTLLRPPITDFLGAMPGKRKVNNTPFDRMRHARNAVAAMEKIPAPTNMAQLVNRSSATDNDLQCAMRLDGDIDKLKKLTTFLRGLAPHYLDVDISFESQDPGAWEQFVVQVFRKRPIFRRYVDGWPIEAYIKRYLSKRLYYKKRAMAAAQPTQSKEEFIRGWQTSVEEDDDAITTYGNADDDPAPRSASAFSGSPVRPKLKAQSKTLMAIRGIPHTPLQRYRPPNLNTDSRFRRLHYDNKQRRIPQLFGAVGERTVTKVGPSPLLSRFLLRSHLSYLEEILIEEGVDTDEKFIGLLRWHQDHRHEYMRRLFDETKLKRFDMDVLCLRMDEEGKSATPSPGSSSMVMTDSQPVARFLGSQIPSMRHLLPLFIREGYDNPQRLDALLALGAAEREAQFRRLLNDRVGMRSFDFETLRHNFECEPSGSRLFQ
ncbi:hypothetical protein PLICRDRAFT_622014 [Plicaturopsis crispa FD-325 SS-3]|nr:hypothetical protein PLICRDRAFT_622014 [Plicaturopsis crispa FD-325 SS-3]